jgi:hypothetical protein
MAEPTGRAAADNPFIGSDFLSVDEAAAVLRGAALAAGEEGITDAEIERLDGWASETRFNAVLLGLVLRGEMRVRWPDGEDDPRFLPVGEEARMSRPELPS